MMSIEAVISIVILIALCALIRGLNLKNKASGKSPGSGGSLSSAAGRRAGAYSERMKKKTVSPVVAGASDANIAEASGMLRSIDPSSGIADEKNDWLSRQLKEEDEAARRISSMLGINEFGSDARKLRLEHEILHEDERRRRIRR